MLKTVFDNHNYNFAKVMPKNICQFDTLYNVFIKILNVFNVSFCPILNLLSISI